MELEIKATTKQILGWEAWNDPEKQIIIFGGGAGGGKSYLGCQLMLVGALRYPGSRWFIARNELKRLMATTYKTFVKVCKDYDIKGWRLDGKYNVIMFDNGSEIHLLDIGYKPSDPDYERLGSYEFTGGFGDEISEWAFDAYDILKSRIGRNNLFPIYEDEEQEVLLDTLEVFPKFFGACNPSKNWVMQTFYYPWKKDELPDNTTFIQSLYQDNPYTAKSYGKQLEGIANKTNKARLMFGEWEYADDIADMTSYEALSDMFSNAVKKDGEKYMVIDVARQGEDSTVFALWDGLECYKIEKFEKINTAKIKEIARDYATKEQIPYSNILVDMGGGYGGGVIDQMEGINGFMGSASPLVTKEQIRMKRHRLANERIPSTIYNHLKSQCAFKMAELINEKKVACRVGDERDMIIADLSALLRQKDPEKEGKLQIEPKDEVKRQLQRSPDVGDTFIMRAWFELRKVVAEVDPIKDKEITQAQANQFSQFKSANLANSTE